MTNNGIIFTREDYDALSRRADKLRFSRTTNDTSLNIPRSSTNVTVNFSKNDISSYNSAHSATQRITVTNPTFEPDHVKSPYAHLKYQNVPTFPNNNEKFHSTTAYTSVTSEIGQRSIIPINHSFIKYFIR